MRRPVSYSILGIMAVTAAVGVALLLASRRSDLESKILAAYREDASYEGLTISDPLDETLFPPEIVAPTFRWEDSQADADAWLVTIKFQDGLPRMNSYVRAMQWTPSHQQWETIKQRSLEKRATVTILGVDHAAPDNILSGTAISISTSPDEVGAPIFYREVTLPFIEAVKDPSRIRWRFGKISSQKRPPVVLEKLPVCGNCHSFSAEADVLGMDVDYANSKGSYVIDSVAEEMVFDRSKVITWDDYKKEEGELSFGLLSQISPDGKHVISTVKDESVFVPRPGLAFSQLFFPIRGILAYYCRETRTFHALPGADDRQFVHSNPTWSPDGKYIVFARTKAYQLKTARDKRSVLLSPEECREFLEEQKTFVYDLYRIPFNDGKGGKIEPLEGASGNGMSNYFPKYSPDGQWIVFCKARTFMLLQPDSELYIIPAAGGKASRLRCNTRRMNSWHSWSPNSRWLVFSSKANSAYTQLFLTHVDPQGHSSPAVLLSQFTAADRAANIPEFVNADAGAIRKIREQFLDDYSFLRAGNEFLKQGVFDDAARAYAKAVELNPKNADALCNLGITFSYRGLFQEAETYILKALEFEPDNKDFQLNLGIVLARQRRFQEAALRYRKALQIDPQFVRAHVSLGAVLQALGQNDQALQQYETVLSIEPKHAEAHFHLGRLLFQRNDWQQAEEHLAAAIQFQPKIPDAHYYLGRIMQSRGQTPESLACFRRAVAINPNMVMALNALAWVYSTHWDAPFRDDQQAVALAERACQLTKGKVPALLNTLAAAYANAGRFAEAVETTDKAIFLAQQTGNARLAGQIRACREGYLARQPFRDRSGGSSP